MRGGDRCYATGTGDSFEEEIALPGYVARLIDALIRQTSIAFGLPLHIFNVKHYAVIPGLITIQPYKR